MLKRIRFIVLLTLLTGSILSAWSQTSYAFKPVTNTEGFDFFVTWPINADGNPVSTELKLHISSREENKIVIETGKNTQTRRTVSAGQTLEYKVDAVPGTTFFDLTPTKEGQPQQVGVRVYSENRKPMVVYATSLVGTNETSWYDGFHVLPVEALGYEYIVQNTNADMLGSEFVVMAVEQTKDGTNVSITLTDSTNIDKRSSLTRKLKYREAVLIRTVEIGAGAAGQTHSLSGSRICADAKIAVWAASPQTKIPVTTDNQVDFVCDQLLPINKWGSEFVVPMTAMHSVHNELHIIPLNDGTTVNLSGGLGTLNNLKAYQDVTKDIKEAKGIADKTIYVKSDKDHPIQVYLFSTSANANLYVDEVDGIPRAFGNPAMTLIPPVSFASDTMPFTLYNGGVAEEGIGYLTQYVNVWATKDGYQSVKLDGETKPFNGAWKAVDGTGNYMVAKVEVDRKTNDFHVLTADRKCFGGYVHGMATGNAYIYPLGYDFRPPIDSMFLSGKVKGKNNSDEDVKIIDIHTSLFEADYPDKNGGWHLNKQKMPGYTAQDTILICDSMKLRFPLKINDHWDEIKWEIARLNPQTRKWELYTEDLDRQERDTGDHLRKPYMETRFRVQPNKETARAKRPAYEDFEVRAILYRQPTLCESDPSNKDKWARDTLSTIVRAHRMYRDTVYMILCDDDPAIEIFKDPTTKKTQLALKSPKDTKSYEADRTETLQYGGSLDPKATINTYTRSYETSNGRGCDSIITVKVLLCQSDVKDPLELYVCEEDLKDIHSRFGGDFFKDINFAGTFAECKKKNKKDENKDYGNGWKYYATGNNALTWIFTGTDIIRTEDCNPEMEKWHAAPYNAEWPNKRPTIGCDKELSITLHVLAMQEYEYEATTCKKEYTWTAKENIANNPKDFTETYKRTDDIINKTVDYYHYYKGKSKRDGWDDICASEKHILHLTFTGGYRPKEVTMCDDEPGIVVTQASDPDILDPNFKWEFDPKGKSGVYKSERIPCATKDEAGCEYELQYVITVNAVEHHYDTIVYCYDDGKDIYPHPWIDPDGTPHRHPWGQIKGDNKSKTKYDDTTKPVRLKKDKTKLVEYILTDTVIDNNSPCHIVYQQTVLMMPPYQSSNQEQGKPISTKQCFVWHDKCWAGDKAPQDTINKYNTQGCPVYTLKEFGMEVPDDWTVNYKPAVHMYELTTTAQTRVRHRDDGSPTLQCDSAVQLLVQVADEQDTTMYAWTCSSDLEYSWVFNDNVVNVDLTPYNDAPDKDKALPKVYTQDVDTLTSAKFYPVAGIPGHYHLHLTVFPGYTMPHDTFVCQDPGHSITYYDQTFYLNDVDTLIPETQKSHKTEPRTWTNLGTGETYQVRCDSGEVVRVFVHPSYRVGLNEELATHDTLIYSGDTLRYFSNPDTLYVGCDFYLTHPNTPNLDSLSKQSGVAKESIVELNATLIPELNDWTTDDWRYKFATYSTSQQSIGSVIWNGGEKSLCDSTSFLNIHYKKAIVLNQIYMGDNGRVLGEVDATTGEVIPYPNGDGPIWSFGGDTTKNAYGESPHSQSKIDGDYFTYYIKVDENGNVTQEPVDLQEEDFDVRKDSGQGSKNWSPNEDGSRTYTFTDTVWNSSTKTYDIYFQSVIVYPTYVRRIDSIAVCVYDTLDRKKLFGHDGPPIIVADLPRDENRVARAEEIGCTTDPDNDLVGDWPIYTYPNGDTVCVHYILYYDLRVFGTSSFPQVFEMCMNDPPVLLKNQEVSYKVGEPNISGPITDTIGPPEGSNIKCYDLMTLTVKFNPAYGIDEFRGKDAHGAFDDKYINPYCDTLEFCQKREAHWILKDGSEHKPSNLYWSNGIKIDDNKIPTDSIGSYIVRDSLKTVGCKCDSVLTLVYDVVEAPEPDTLKYAVCVGQPLRLPCDTFIVRGSTPETFPLECDNGTSCPKQYVIVLKKEKCTEYEITFDEPKDSIIGVCYDAKLDENYYTISFSCKGSYPPDSICVYYGENVRTVYGDTLQTYCSTIEIDSAQWAANDYLDVFDLKVPLYDELDMSMGVVDATIGFNNGHHQETFVPIHLELRKPSWIMQQRYGDMIVLLDSALNGGHNYSAYQWYEDGDLLEGQTKPYLYIPGGLTPGARYNVQLTEIEARPEGDTAVVSTTCPIIAEAAPNGGGIDVFDDPRLRGLDYLDVVPNCVPLSKPYAYIVSNKENKGTYRISTIEGQYCSSGVFLEGGSTPISLPALEGIYVVQIISSQDTAPGAELIEPVRSVKVVVSEICQE